MEREVEIKECNQKGYAYPHLCPVPAVSMPARCHKDFSDWITTLHVYMHARQAQKDITKRQISLDTVFKALQCAEKGPSAAHFSNEVRHFGVSNLVKMT